MTGCPIRRRVDASSFEDLPGSRSGDYVSEAQNFSVDSAVSPGVVLSCDSDCQLSDGWVDLRPTSRRVWRLGPVTLNSVLVPSQHRFCFDDEKGGVAACPSHCSSEKTENRPVDICELWSVDLALQDQYSVTEGPNLSVTGITRCAQQADSGQDQATERNEHGHNEGTAAEASECRNRWKHETDGYLAPSGAIRLTKAVRHGQQEYFDDGHDHRGDTTGTRWSQICRIVPWVRSRSATRTKDFDVRGVISGDSLST